MFKKGRADDVLECSPFESWFRERQSFFALSTDELSMQMRRMAAAAWYAGCDSTHKRHYEDKGDPAKNGEDKPDE